MTWLEAIKQDKAMLPVFLGYAWRTEPSLRGMAYGIGGLVLYLAGFITGGLFR